MLAIHSAKYHARARPRQYKRRFDIASGANNARLAKQHTLQNTQ